MLQFVLMRFFQSTLAGQQTVYIRFLTLRFLVIVSLIVTVSEHCGLFI